MVSRVSPGVRFLACLLLAAMAVPAAADVESARVPGLPKHTVALSFTAHGGRLAGLSVGGAGPTFEYALGRRRWQYFGEAGVSWVTVGPLEQQASGLEARGGLGLRWLARSFAIDQAGAVELNLEGFTGLQHFWWDRGGRIARPDVGVGVGWQVRVYRRPLIVRMSMRIVFAPADHAAPMELCRSCTPQAAGSDTGFRVLIGAAW